MLGLGRGDCYSNISKALLLSRNTELLRSGVGTAITPKYNTTFKVAYAGYHSTGSQRRGKRAEDYSRREKVSLKVNWGLFDIILPALGDQNLKRYLPNV